MIAKIWILNKLNENNLDKSSVYDLYEQYQEECDSNCDLESFKRQVRRYYEQLDGLDLKDYDDESVLRTEAQRQKQIDLNSQLRKTNREQYRVYNNLEEIYTQYVDLLSNVDLTKFKLKPYAVQTNGKVLLIQISDVHFNELINSSEANGNNYDFIIASKRLKKFISKCKQYAKMEKITEINLILTGDLINSSRRLGEKLAQSTSLVKASLLATYLLEQAIVDLAKDFSTTVSSVVGNESRIQDEWDSSSISLSENYDFLIFENLRRIFNKTKVRFTESKNLSQQVVHLSNGFNALIIHGNQLSKSNTDRDIAKILQQYVYQGIKIHGVYYGHYHSASISDFVSRCGSLCGGNAYSTNDLGFLSRASQNCYIINPDLGCDGIKFDLQNCDNDEYDIKEELERYDVRNCNFNTTVTIKNLT